MNSRQQDYDYYYDQCHQRQQQHLRKLWLLSQYHRRQRWLFHRFSGQKSSWQHLFHIHLIRFLLLLVCYGCHTRAMDYSQELSNCFDQVLAISDRSTSTAELARMPVMTSSTPPESDEMFSLHNEERSYPTSGILGTTSGNDNTTTTPDIDVAPSFVAGWKCCCWNATKQVKLLP